MKRHHTLFVLLMIIVLISIACSLPGSVSTVTKAVTPGADTPAPTAVPAAAVPSGPLSLVQLYEARLKAGDWTEGQGLVQLLGMYTDPTQTTDPVGSYTLKDEELTGLLRTADQYLTNNPNDQYHTAVQKQVSLLVPPLDKLELFSKKHSLSAAPHLASLNPSTTTDTPDCQDLWMNGFDSTPITCFEYSEQTVDGTTVRLYYPSTWPVADPRRAKLGPIVQAAARAVHIFNGYGPEPLPPVTLVITELAWMDQATHRRVNNLHGLAVRGNSSSLSCYVGLFPSLLSFSVDQMQQGVAHEMFHCYQYQNLSAQERSSAHNENDWWVEGSAEYFSNVVYPSANFEQRDMDILVSHIDYDNLFAWSYKAYLFFQYLENRPDFGGSAGILNLLRSMPAAAGTGFNEQAAALAGYSNMGIVFQEFAQAIADNNIIDTDHNPIQVPVEPITADTVEAIPEGTILGGAPFTIYINRVVFPRNFNYNLTVTTQNQPGQAGARLESSPRTWAPLPSQVDTGCETVNYLVVATNTNPDLNAEHYFEYFLRVTSQPVVNAGICDCLPGSWLLDDSTYLTHLNAIIDQAAPGTVDYRTVDGSDVVTFTRDGHVTQAIDQLVINADMHVQDMPVQALTVSMDGTSEASFTAEEGILHYTGYESNLTISTLLNGSPLSVPNSDFASGPIGSGASFVCSENTLSLTPKYPNYSGLPPLTFTRQP
jgi:hypothetical protein